MWFTKLLDTMSKFFPNNVSESELLALSKLNPDKFYVENVRSILNVTTAKAQNICDISVRQGFFSTGTEFICPDGSVALSVEVGQKVPKKVTCYLEVDNSYDEFEMKTDELERYTFYKLK